MANFSGKWQANLQKSKFLSAPPGRISVWIEHSGGRLNEEVRSTGLDGTEHQIVFTCTTTGEEGQSTLNGKSIQGRAYWDDDELIVESWMHLAGRELYFRDCWSLSSDGRTLSMEHRDGALKGQLTVLERIEQDTPT